MWYKIAIKYNIYGLPISSDAIIKQFAIEDEELPQLQPSNENITDDSIEDAELQQNELIIDDPTPEDEFNTEDLQKNVQVIEVDPTALMKLPPLHDNCRCIIETIPYLSDFSINDGRRIWKKAEDCCPVCEKSALEFNKAEIVRLTNKINQILSDRQ